MTDIDEGTAEDLNLLEDAALMVGTKSGSISKLRAMRRLVDDRIRNAIRRAYELGVKDAAPVAKGGES